jgi:4-hydroxy-2-oxoheptanedioate aldolase
MKKTLANQSLTEGQAKSPGINHSKPDCLSYRNNIFSWDKKKWLSDAKFRFGTYVQTADTAVVEILALAGFDFAVIDCEHSALSMEKVKNLIICCITSGIVPFVRVKSNSAHLIMEALDAGAYGIQIPQISNSKAAKESIQASKYYPLGERGLNPYVRAAGYGYHEISEYMKYANDNVVTHLLLEGRKGISNIDDILGTAGVDVVWPGPYDLSQSMGIPGQVGHPDILSKIEEIIKKARMKDIAAGIFSDNVEIAKKWIKLGFNLVAVSYETKMLLEKASAIADSLKDSL